MIQAIQKDGEDQGRWIPAKSANINDKLANVIKWFDGNENEIED